MKILRAIIREDDKVMNTIFEREIKDQNYTVMSNYHLRDKNISLKASR